MTITHTLFCGHSPVTRWGATQGQQDLGTDLVSRIQAADQPVVILDFSGIEAANASYVRATALWMLRCALKARDTGDYPPSADPWRIQPLRLEGIFLAGLSEEVRNDIAIQLNEGRLACAEVIDCDDDQVRKVAILGHLDTQLRRTLDCLLELGGECTADRLWKHFTEDRIGPTGWNNRLAELYQSHLINRRKEGKFWKYFTTFKEVTNGIRLFA